MMEGKFTIHDIFRINPAKILNFLLLTVLFVYLEYVYKSFVVAKFEYAGFGYSFDTMRYAETKLLYLISFIILHVRRGNSFVYAIFFLVQLFLFIPNSIYYEYMDTTRLIPYSIFLLLVVIPSLSPRSATIDFPAVKPGHQIALLLLIVMLLIIPVVIDFGLNVNTSAFGFQDIYDIRDASAGKASRITVYAYSWLGKVIVPVLLLTGLIRKNLIAIGLGVIILLYLFAVAGHKSVFFGLLVVLAFYFIKDHTRQVSAMLIMIFLAFLATRFLSEAKGSIMAESIVVRRTFFLPAQLTSYYFEAFKDAPVYLAHSIFSGVFEYPHKYDPSHYIAGLYYGNPAKNANNGIISDAYMNFGVAGIPVFVFFFSVIVTFLGSLRINSRYFGLFFLMVYVFVSSAFITSLITHGILFLIVISLLFLTRSDDKARG